jgi:hypothetical protein
LLLTTHPLTTNHLPLTHSPTRQDCPRGAAWSARHPVKVEVVGSNPIGDALRRVGLLGHDGGPSSRKSQFDSGTRCWPDSPTGRGGWLKPSVYRFESDSGHHAKVDQRVGVASFRNWTVWVRIPALVLTAAVDQRAGVTSLRYSAVWVRIPSAALTWLGSPTGRRRHSQKVDSVGSNPTPATGGVPRGGL